jgi:hypothetical protein
MFLLFAAIAYLLGCDKKILFLPFYWSEVKEIYCYGRGFLVLAHASAIYLMVQGIMCMIGHFTKP